METLEKILNPCSYVISVRFTTDRPMTEEETDQLLNAVAVQIEEPSGLELNKRADFETVSAVEIACVATHCGVGGVK